LRDPQPIVDIDPVLPGAGMIEKAGKILSAGGVVIFPAKCLYGIATHALNPNAIERVFNLKQRPKHNPILVLVKDQTMLASLVTNIPHHALKLMDAFWPGNLTLIFHARDHIPGLLTAGTGKIGIRIPVHPVARALVNQVDFPITGTSANLSGEKGCNRVDQLTQDIIKNSDLVLNAGSLKGGKGSTIADVTQREIQILRQGEISADQIRNALT
jgi:L-threonylcarbamoyladenylate synthase